MIGRIGLSAGLLLGGTGAFADGWNKRTYVTFAHPVEAPGTLLPPGQYVIQLAESAANRHAVQILSADGSEALATAPVISSFRVALTSKTVLTFYEMPGGRPPALKSWYYPGDSYGQRFAYPKSRATEIARLTGQHVPIAPENQETVERLASPETGRKALGQFRRPAPPADAAAAADPVPGGPGTGVGRTADDSSKTSNLPLAGLIGAATVLAAAGLRVLTKRFATKRFV